jgi:hypothetical protein
VHVLTNALTTSTPCAADCFGSITPNDATETAAPTTTNRMVADAVFTAGNTTVTSATATFKPSDVGLLIVNATAKLPKGTYIKSRTNNTTIVVSSPPAKSVAANALIPTYIGLPNGTAPLDNDVIANIGTELILSPSLVDGARPCSEGTPTGSLFLGAWENPGSKGFATAKHKTELDFTGVNLSFLDSPAVGQILYSSSVVAFAAYVEQRSASPSSYSVALPFLPVGIGVCPGTDQAATFQFLGEGNSQLGAAQGTGKPGTPPVRALDTLGAAPVTPDTSTVTVDLYDGPTLARHYTGLGSCTTDRPADLGSFPCGIG